MTLAREAALAILARAVLDLAGADAPAAARLRGRLREVSPEASAVADRAGALTGYRAPDLTQPLQSIFSLVNGNATANGAPLFMMPQSLTLCPQYPRSGTIAGPELAEAVAALRAALQRDLAHLPPDPNALLFLLDKYAWAVSGGAPGLAFADAARLAAAAAGALAHGCSQLLLVGADLSGVQRFIYTISAKGALRSLRARSFLLELISEEVARRVLARLRLTRANLIYAGGGHLYLLAPDTPAARDIVETVQSELNDWLLATMGGMLYLAMGMAAFAPSLLAPGAEGVPDVWRQVAAAVGRDKSARFRAAVQDASFWAPRPLGQATCEVCHQETDDPGHLSSPEGEDPVPRACPTCRDLYEFGGKLPRAQFLVAATPSPTADVRIAGTGYHVCEDASAVRQIAGAQAVMAINALEAADLAVAPDTYPVWLGTHAQRTADGRTMATFADLAAAATGKPLLGVLRMDVDSLGRLFTGGLPPRCRDFGRTAGLSGALTRFFKLHVNSLCEGDGGAGFESLRLTRTTGRRPVTIVYSGGDDLFVVGAWDQTLELAFDIRASFRRFCGGRLTISAGVVAHDYHQPIHRLAELAGAAEEAAKNNEDRMGQDRDNIAPLFTGVQPPNDEGRARAPALKWDEAADMIEHFLKPALGPLGYADRPGTRVPRRVLYGLLGLTDYWVDQGPLYLPRLAYIVARVDKRLRDDPTWKGFRNYLLTHPYEMAQFPPFVTWLDLIGRGGSEHE